ncbi:MAG: orotidine 5'-phosphate decarboxylase [Candidatus Thorarchaeota archaeon]|nr:MAG: orotidine 5'-phosphate decarboxylase [Candidatus Thorarchaeota archaeon]
MYKQKLNATSFVRKSKLIIGLDLVADFSGKDTTAIKMEQDRLERETLKIITQTAEHAVAFKINRHLVLPLGIAEGIPRIVDKIHDEGLTAIIDCKLNDIGNTNKTIAKYYFDAGFDAMIVNPLVGMEGGLDSVFELAKNRKRGIITLCYMSHPAAKDGYGLVIAPDDKVKKAEPLYIRFARQARLWDVDGIIVGATHPEKIKEIRAIVGDDNPILRPSVGAQGGSARAAIDAGANFVIVVRSIIEASDPSAAAASFAAEIR